jgi:hypothetical protein
MSRKPLSKLLVLLLVSFAPALANATSYYIDYASGSDSNSGTTNSSPLQHVPGMVGCTANCASTTPHAGDRIILKGGVTWPNSVFPISWKWSGSGGSDIYVGVDQAWYSGGSWTRPIFDAGGSPISGTYNEFIRAMSTSYVQWDNIEMKGINWSSNPGYGNLACGVFSGGTNITISNWYVHGWSHTGGASSDSFNCVLGDTNSPYMSGSVIQNSVFDGTDSTNGGDSGSFTYAWPSVIKSVIHDCSNALLLVGHGEAGNNLIYNVRKSFDASQHENGIEAIGSDGGAYYIHDNVIHDVYAECIMIGNPGESDYVWNNVIYQGAAGNCNTVDFPQNGKTGAALHIWNNTVVPRSGGYCFRQVGGAATPIIDIQNNHCVTTGPMNSSVSSSSLTLQFNVVTAPNTASSDGYTSTETFAYSPTSGSGPTVGAGTDLNGLATGLIATLVQDTTYGCTEDGSHQAICPARTSLSRSSSWDAGAYQFSGSAVQKPSAPTGLKAVVN